jgi:hypothetical protein
LSLWFQSSEASGPDLLPCLLEPRLSHSRALGTKWVMPVTCLPGTEQRLEK